MNYCDELLKNALFFKHKRLAHDVDTGREITYGDFAARVKATSAHLCALGIGPGVSVAIHLLNSIDAAIFHMAVQFVGARSCFIDALVQPAMLQYYLDLTQAKLLSTHLDISRVRSEIQGDIALLAASDIESISHGSAHGAPSVPHSFAPDDVCYVYFTSGTTDKPKGVMLTAENHRSFNRICDAYWRPVTAASRHLCYVPFSHGFGTIFLLPLAIRTGSELFIMRAFHPMRVTATIAEFDITHIYGVPSHYQQLLRYPEKGALRRLEMAFCAAAKLEHDLMLAWAKATGTILCEGYGLIETCCGIVWRVGTPSLGTGHMGPCPDPELVALRILGPDLVPRRAGETGQIAVRGDSVMEGYLKNPEETSRVIKDGWFLTGDAGYLTEDNQLFMTGRIKDIINIAGIKVSPYEVEAVLLEHPEVAEVAVVATRDTLYGEVVKAYVRPEPCTTPTQREIIQFAATRLINYQVPKQIEFLHEFPLNNMGKLDRNKLKALNPL